ncbi:DUF6035 family protein [Marinobacterium iners]|uniref:DUF6035 domain-containing protein n=1 Tax=Marinobacterium iners DSM 11526 TaxID=1122198 RepID=A0A1H4CSL7_9GAMM|nr:DUF6035 family protein [Marinobacterium iners]SEA63344.1 hypothetical protein SAMN02745729_105126 [Marinobacterium iners DSM 11526]
MRKLQIPIVLDSLHNEMISVEFFEEHLGIREIHELRANNENKKRFLCFHCKSPVLLYARRSDSHESGHKYHVQHQAGKECLWKRDSKTLGEIYAGIKEGKRHREMKKLLQETLEVIDGWEVIDVDRRFIASLDNLERRKPDLHAKFKGQDVVFEIQIRSEDPTVIVKRKAFYKKQGMKLVWLSSESSELVSETYKTNALEMKQVQKDIAFANRGNIFFFNGRLSKISKTYNVLKLMAKYIDSTIIDGLIKCRWNDKIISFEDVNFKDGAAFYYDFISADDGNRQELELQGKRFVAENISSWQCRTWEDFLVNVKKGWPFVEITRNSEWLYQVYKEDYNDRVLRLKKTIIKILLDKKNDIRRWNRCARQLGNNDFGISPNVQLNVIASLLVISGYPVMKNTGPVRAAHNFYDHPSFHSYFNLFLLILNNSPYKEMIINDDTMSDRLRKDFSHIEQKTDFHEFMSWFLSEPKL